MDRIKFTTERVAAIPPPPEGEISFADTEVPGLVLRVRPSGSKTWMVRYRAGGGRNATNRKDRIGNATTMSVADARNAAKAKLGAVAQGRDPASEKRAAIKQLERRLDRAIPAYIESLRKRQLVKVKDIETLLTRELVSRFGAAQDISELTRRDFSGLFDGVEASGRPGTAADLKSHCSTFLNWLVGQGIISANTLAGMRRPRSTRAKALEDEEKARALSEQEIKLLWAALDAIDRPYFAAYMKFLLLTGCRRTESAALRRSWFRKIDDRPFCIIPAAQTKSGRDHIVAIPPLLDEIIQLLPKQETDPDLIFSGRRGKKMSGWTQLMKPLRDELAARGFNGALRLHDLRKTARGWWPILGAEEAICERMISHRAKNTLVRIYDKNERLPERYDLTRRWTERVIELVNGPSAPEAQDDHNVVQLVRRA